MKLTNQVNLVSATKTVGQNTGLKQVNDLTV